MEYQLPPMGAGPSSFLPWLPIPACPLVTLWVSTWPCRVQQWSLLGKQARSEMDRQQNDGGMCGAPLPTHSSQPDSPWSTLGVTMCSDFGSPGLEGDSGRSPAEMNSFFCSPYFRTWTLGIMWGG